MAASTRPDLVERDSELAVLEAAVAQAVRGDGCAVAIEGPAGIGKTRLLAELRRQGAEAGMRVLTARGGELEREFPFGAARQLFEELVAGEERELALAGSAASAGATLGAPGGDEAPDADPSFAALHGLYWLALNLAAERPLMLAIDDLQWCDRPSLRFLAYLVRRLEDQPIIVAATIRTGEPDVDLALLGELSHDPVTTPVRPGPLSTQAVATAVRARLGGEPDAAFCQACHRTTGGNPLLLGQLLAALQADGVQPDAAHAKVVDDIGPRAVSRTVLVRLARLPASAASAARAVAVLGESAGLASIASLTGLDEETVAEALATLVRAEILRPEPPLSFVHPLVREAIYRELPPGERELHHARAAQVLAGAGADTEHVAAQLLLAPRRGDAWAVEVLRTGARFALGKGAPESAVTYLRRALDEPPPADVQPSVHLELGLAEAVATSGPSAAGHLAQAYETLAGEDDRIVAADLLSRMLLLTSSAADGAAFARRALAELRGAGEDQRTALEAVELTAVFFDAGDPSELRRLDPYRDPARALGGTPGVKMLAGLAAFDQMLSGEDRESASKLALASLHDGSLVAADPGLIPMGPLAVLGYADREDADEQWDLVLAYCHRHGSLYGLAAINLWRGSTLQHRRGDLVEAEAALRSAMDAFADWGNGTDSARYGGGGLASILIDRGDLEGARQALALSGEAPGTSDASYLWTRAHIELLLAEGRAEEAAAAALDIGSRGTRVVNPAFIPWRSLRAEALARLERRDEAMELAAAEVEAARRWGAPSPIARALRALGIAAGGAEGLAHLERAVETVAGSVARLEEAKAHAALGSALRRARRPSESREPLRRALELADACGAAVLVEHVRAELYATGARPRTTALSGAASLTASEQRVVKLAIDGQSNRDIAQSLFVTPKTVEVHLSSAYRKLGVRSRHDLAAALA